ncbi:hypothetical protein F2Q68_00013004 [Brassica cretica]|uniref:Uncharacterized protein n=1 Tax=Brassica cretica TaxID=69181 RepID=A0A8S9HPE6_BRACR|nr:hypothetical protein F2Q68_00013004 [Brassica cretica]
MVVRGRSLMMVHTNDYDEPSANRRHNPPGGRRGGGRKRDINGGVCELVHMEVCLSDSSPQLEKPLLRRY